ncbi:MAG: Zn-dependent alcohol dehydrogenase [Pseudomonadota bacterium]
MQRIKAAVCHEFGQGLTLDDVLLRSPRADEVEVDIHAVAICHSDISYLSGDWGGVLPAVYGHEAAGVIRAVGNTVTGFEPGDPVVVTLIRACAYCSSCYSGRPFACSERQTLEETPLWTLAGEPIEQGMQCGAFAERVVVHHSQVVRVSPQLPLPQASLLACGVITGIGAVVNVAELRVGQDAVVIGAGGVGLNAIQGARIAGARRIVALDMNESKLKTALDFGATHSVLASDDDCVQQVLDAIGRGADAVFVTVGSAQAYNGAADYLAPAGRIVMVGMPATGALSTFEPANLAALGQQMLGSKMGDSIIQRDIPWLEDLYLQGRLKLDELVSRIWSLDRINEAIDDTRAGEASRNVIIPQ